MKDDKSTPAMESSIRTDEPWQVQDSEVIHRNDFFRVRRDRCALKRAQQTTADLYVLELPSSVIVVPLTADGEFIMLEQYRHGAGQWVVECPGGNIEKTESLETTAHRELYEETGYCADSIFELNAHPQDPSCQSGRCFAYLALGCTLHTEPTLDDFEAIRVRTFTRDEMWEQIHIGTDFHLPSLAAVLQVLASPTLIHG
ncbi:MAG: NUDIX hydrolase [Gammaproteobacteria bacterium]